MSVTVAVDSRESKLIEKLQKSYPKFNFKIETLPVGDIALRVADQTVFLLERKTWSDLVSSIIDKRFHEQGFRLAQSGIRYAYLLEGTYPKKPRIHPNALRGLIFNAQIRDKVQFLRTANLSDTAKLCTELCKRFHSTKKGTGLSAPVAAHTASVLGKRDRMEDSSTILVRQLMCIPKVSEPIARLLVENFGTREGIRHAANSDEISNIKYNGRRLGKVANNIENNI